jgi:hypothetical protein
VDIVLVAMIGEHGPSKRGEGSLHSWRREIAKFKVEAAQKR